MIWLAISDTLSGWVSTVVSSDAFEGVMNPKHVNIKTTEGLMRSDNKSIIVHNDRAKAIGMLGIAA